jgi:hypothetical protein
LTVVSALRKEATPITHIEEPMVAIIKAIIIFSGILSVNWGSCHDSAAIIIINKPVKAKGGIFKLIKCPHY